MPRVDVETHTTINAPLEEVARFAADPSNAPAWYASIRSVEWEGPARVETGARVAFEARFLGRTLRYTYQIVDFVPGERLVMETAQGPFPMQTTYTWAAESNTSTTMTLRNAGEPAGFNRLVAPFLASAMRRANRGDLARLRKILERA
jgi:uncharacterized protein YndB with AHSA1/START domain